ncbi:hypothetical protein BKK52_11925 [Rodentibacter trehalosifermentans]|uniref:Uncharacterized protein n=1 Tax=Rodentibacter trehalosifermentans TaxID=1908263 RepID=A0A1V3IUS6_9PAST|nr:hypothetical protein [Rodentibacter trehalosifermentans]OOF45937.1 hypothetical protein BKK52_11925 [Rodentibacter trehalosifermentans]OOF53623.1 hypothetical protein BKK53_00450 [Rodentibacter trehalosifermentans]
MARKKPRITNHSELLIPHSANKSKPNYSIVRFISNLLTTVSIGGNMSENGADKAGQTISTGIKFFLCCGGIALLAVAFAFGYYLIK